MIRKSRIVFLLIFSIGLLLAGIYGLSEKTVDSPVIITEVCVHNVSAAYDDNGDYGADYVELYNRSDSSVNLQGWGLSDDGKKLAKYVFPDMVLEPGQAIIAWSSPNIDNTALYLSYYLPVDVHDLGFNISGGEYCVLTDPEGNVASDVRIPQYLGDDDTYSCTLDNLSEYSVQASTPYYVASEKAEIKEKLENPVFSRKGGWFDNDIEVEITASEGTIYYTLDGSVPDENSFVYDGPVTITNRTSEANIYSAIGGIASDGNYIPDFNVDKGTVLKAVAISDDGASDVVSNTYFVGLSAEEYENLGIISISFDPEDLFGHERGIYVIGKVAELHRNKVDLQVAIEDYWNYYNYGKKGRGWEREVQIEYIPSGTTEVSYMQDVGIRIHGGYSVNHNQKNFQIYARQSYDGSDYLNYDFWQDGSSFSKLMLRGGGSEDQYVTKIRDIFLQSLVSDRAVGIQRAIPCAVFLNGEYWGLYNIQETIDESYIREKYGVDEDNVIIIKNGESRSDYPEDYKLYEDVLDFAANNDMSVMENYRRIEDMIDIQSCIDYYATEIYVANCDAYENNWAVWRSRSLGSGAYEDGKFRWLIFDLDDAAGIENGLTTAEVDSFLDGSFYDVTPLNGDVLFSSLIRNQEFRDRFVSSFTEMAFSNFAYENVAPKLWELSSIYRNGVIRSHERFRGDFELYDYQGFEGYEAPYDDEDFGTDIGYIDAFFRERGGYILEYMKNDLGLEE